MQRIAPTLRSWADAGVPFLAIAAGWQLLGRELTDVDGSSIPGAGVFPTVATLTDHRFVGEVSGQSELGTVAGFENHSAVTILDEGASPLARLERGHGKLTDEGVVAGELVGTNLHGAFLPMNPHWADRLLDAAIRLAGVQPADVDSRMFDVDAEARRARDAIRTRLGLRTPRPEELRDAAGEGLSGLRARTPTADRPSEGRVSKGAQPRYSRGIRRLARTTISSPIVPAQPAQSSAVGSLRSRTRIASSRIASATSSNRGPTSGSTTSGSRTPTSSTTRSSPGSRPPTTTRARPRCLRSTPSAP